MVREPEREREDEKNGEVLEVGSGFGYCVGLHVVGWPHVLLSHHQTST